MARTDEAWEEEGGIIKPTNPNGSNLLLNGSNKYLNFGSASGSSGYGFRDDSGIVEVKNSSGEWQPVLITVSATPPADPVVNQLWVDIS